MKRAVAEQFDLLGGVLLDKPVVARTTIVSSHSRRLSARGEAKAPVSSARGMTRKETREWVLGLIKVIDACRGSERSRRAEYRALMERLANLAFSPMTAAEIFEVEETAGKKLHAAEVAKAKIEAAINELVNELHA